MHFSTHSACRRDGSFRDPRAEKRVQAAEQPPQPVQRGANCSTYMESKKNASFLSFYLLCGTARRARVPNREVSCPNREAVQLQSPGFAQRNPGYRRMSQRHPEGGPTIPRPGKNLCDCRIGLGLHPFRVRGRVETLPRGSRSATPGFGVAPLRGAGRAGTLTRGAPRPRALGLNAFGVGGTRER